MYEFQVSYTLYRPTDIDILKGILISQKIDSPVFIVDEGDMLLVKMVTDYEYYELDQKIEEAFAGYEFCEGIGRGRQEVRVEVNRYQSNFGDDWGRPIEDRLDETKYLIRKRAERMKESEYNPKIKTLFLDEERDYHINIIPGIDRTTQKKGHLILNSFEKLDDKNDIEFIQKLYENYSDAFWSAFHKLEDKANEDFKAFKKKRKRRIR